MFPIVGFMWDLISGDPKCISPEFGLHNFPFSRGYFTLMHVSVDANKL